MPNSGYFDVAFGVSGPLSTVPDAVQIDGSVSYTQGYGPNYTLAPGTSGALNVDNASMNQIFYDITLAIQQYQQNGIPPFITTAMNNGSPYSYAQYATVIYNGAAYISNTAGNTDTPPSSKWNPVILSSPNQFTAGTSTGSANAQVLASLSPAVGFSTGVNGQTITFTPGFTNSGSMTLAITSPSVSATAVKKVSGGILVNLTGGEVVNNAIAYVTYDLAATCYVLQAGPVLGTIAQLNTGNNIQNDTNGNAVASVPALPLTGTSKTFTLAEWGAQIARSNSGTPMTDTLPGTSGALPAGWYVQLQNGDATASESISVGSGGSIFYGNQNLSSPGFIIEPGETWTVISQGSGAYEIQRTNTATLHAASIQSDFKNLHAVWASNTTVTLSADAIIVQDSNGNTRKLSTYSQTLNSATSGAGGLDTGSVAGTTWYYVYAIFNPATNTQSILMSLSASSPTLPSGYTFASGVISAVKTDGSAHFLGFTQYGRDVQYVVGNNLSVLPQLIAGSSGSVTSPTWTAVSVSAYIPTAVAGKGKFMLMGAANTNTGMAAPNNSYGAYTSTSNPPPMVTDPNTVGGAVNVMGEFLLESTNVYYAGISSGNALICMGYTLNI